MADQLNSTLDTETPSNIAPGLDSELDAALNKAFKRDIQPEGPKEKVELKKEDEVKIDKPLKDNASDKVEEIKDPPIKKEEDDKSLPDPDKIADAPSAKSSNASKEGWNALKNNYKKAHRLAEERNQEILNVKKALADQVAAHKKEIESIRAEKNDLEKYRAMVDIQADPEFVSKFDKPIEVATQGVHEMLKKLGVSEENLSKLNFTDTETLDKMVSIVNQTDRFKASKLERAFKEIVDLMDKRNGTITDHQKNYKETLEKKKQESFAKSAESEGRMIKHIELKSSELGKDGNPLIPFLNRIEPKENATQAEINQVANHNSLVDVMTKKLQDVLKMKDPEQQAEVAIAAVASHYLMAELKSTREQLRKANEELSKISNVSTETTTRKPPAINRNGNQHGAPVDVDSALNTFFKR